METPASGATSVAHVEDPGVDALPVGALPVDATPGTDDVVRSQRSLELLTDANRAILGELSLTAVLRQIAGSARELVGARHATLTVLGPDGEVAEIVEVGTGPRVLRGADVLGVRIKVREVVYGDLDLTGRVGGGRFTAQDRTTVRALAATAGTAIENARLFEDSQRRQHWAEAAAQVSSALLDPSSGTDPLALIADTVLRLAQADAVSVVVPVPDAEMFRVQLARGRGTADIEGLVYPASHSVAAYALATGRGVRIASLAEQADFAVHLRRVLDVGAVLGLPLHGSVTSHGALVVGRRAGRPPFDLTDLELSESFAAQAAIAIELSEARADQQRLLVLRDRERIARDLHDHVIQRLFASGLSLEGLAGTLDPAPAARLVSVVDDLDVTIRQIRNLVFRLQTPESVRTLRSAVLQVTEEAADVLGFAPDVSFEGPVDTVADESLVDDVVAVAREALSNVVRHARAGRVAVQVLATASTLVVLVTDDGTGMGDRDRRSGLRNLRQRAADHGGVFEVGDGLSGGTVLRWSVPLP